MTLRLLPGRRRTWASVSGGSQRGHASLQPGVVLAGIFHVQIVKDYALTTWSWEVSVLLDGQFPRPPQPPKIQQERGPKGCREEEERRKRTRTTQGSARHAEGAIPLMSARLCQNCQRSNWCSWSWLCVEAMLEPRWKDLRSAEGGRGVGGRGDH